MKTLQTQYDEKYKALEMVRAELDCDPTPERLTELLARAEELISDLTKIQLAQLNQEGAE